MKINLGVIFGGKSVEHEISIISATQAIKHLDKEKYDIFPIFIDKEGIFRYSKALTTIDLFKDMELVKRYSKPITIYKKDNRFVVQSLGMFKKELCELDLVLPIVHGTTVEDGTLQGYLDTIGIPYAGCDVFAGAVGQDKIFMKQIFQSMNIDTPKYVWFFESDYENDFDKIMKQIKSLKLPLFIKPAKLGSSIGISKVLSYDEIDDAVTEAFRYDNKIIVEEGINNLKEVNISVLGNYAKQEVSAIEEVMANDAFLTYNDKYLGGKKGKMATSSKGMVSTLRKIPADLNKNVEEDIKNNAKLAFRALNCSGVVRIDFLVDDKENKVYINEINSCPGSLSFYLWEPTGKKYQQLLDDIIDIAIKNYKQKERLTYSFSSNVLSNFNGSKGIKGLKK